MKRTLLLTLFCAPAVFAQYAPAPTAYTATAANSMMGPTVTMQVSRDGDKAVVDQTFSGGHTHTLYDLTAHQTYSWDPANASAPCGRGTFSGDWGDPFAMSAEMAKEVNSKHPKELGSETVNGFTTKVYESADPAGALTAKVWLEPKYGLIVKLDMTQKGSPTRTIMETKQLNVARPAAALFALPASCGQAAAPPAPAPSDGMADAIMPPASPKACSVQFKIVRAGSMTPIASGFQVALDLNVNLEHAASYKIGAGQNGATFSGGNLREVTSQFRNGVLRIDNAPAHWDVEIYSAKAGAASALIYRQCFGAQPTLLLVLKNPEKISEGADWRWVK
jgi:hypothetical protein